MFVQIEAPFKPVIKNDTDVSYFDTDFTSEEPELTPPEEGMCRPDLIIQAAGSYRYVLGAEQPTGLDNDLCCLCTQVTPRHM